MGFFEALTGRHCEEAHLSVRAYTIELFWRKPDLLIVHAWYCEWEAESAHTLTIVEMIQGLEIELWQFVTRHSHNLKRLPLLSCVSVGIGDMWHVSDDKAKSLVHPDYILSSKYSLGSLVQLVIAWLWELIHPLALAFRKRLCLARAGCSSSLSQIRHVLTFFLTNGSSISLYFWACLYILGEFLGKLNSGRASATLKGYQHTLACHSSSKIFTSTPSTVSQPVWKV